MVNPFEVSITPLAGMSVLEDKTLYIDTIRLVFTTEGYEEYGAIAETEVRFTVSVKNGTLVSSSRSVESVVEVRGNGERSVLISGQFSEVKDYLFLGSFVYRPDKDFAGVDTITVSAVAALRGSVTVTESKDIQVTAINDAAYIILPGPQEAYRETDLAITGLEIADVDSKNEPIDVQFETKYGTLMVLDVEDGVDEDFFGPTQQVSLSGDVDVVSKVISKIGVCDNKWFSVTVAESQGLIDVPEVKKGASISAYGAGFSLTGNIFQINRTVSGMSVSGSRADVSLLLQNKDFVFPETDGVSVVTTGSEGHKEVRVEGPSRDVTKVLAFSEIADNADVTVKVSFNPGSQDKGKAEIKVDSVDGGAPLVTIGANKKSLSMTGTQPQVNKTLQAISLFAPEGGVVTTTILTNRLGIVGLKAEEKLTIEGPRRAGAVGRQGTSYQFENLLKNDAIVYRGGKDFTGFDYIITEVDDRGHTGFVSARGRGDKQTLDLLVRERRDPPLLVVPTTSKVKPNKPGAIKGISVVDTGNTNDVVTVTLVVSHGKLSVDDSSGATVTEE